RRSPRLHQLGGERARVETKEGKRVVVGTLRNLDDLPLGVVRVDAVGRDTRGAPTAWASRKLEGVVPDPDAVRDVEIPLEDHVIEEPAYWTLFAVGAPR
ncbi:MAG: hypothetical protein KC656_33920, partial [Myxococcales bacterium]|nr:hypothetical protein [Myxococcales bacterium]